MCLSKRRDDAPQLIISCSYWPILAFQRLFISLVLGVLGCVDFVLPPGVPAQSCSPKTERLKVDETGSRRTKIFYISRLAPLSHHLVIHRAGHYLSSLASVQPCNPAAVVLVPAPGSSVTQADTMAALCSPHSIVLPWNTEAQ